MEIVFDWFSAVAVAVAAGRTQFPSPNMSLKSFMID